ncbi:Gfo/Idh/MocA family oxidoreductase [Salinimicrobium sp. HB62]|uniref:Gfo/Idh/MocA family oxidoreductase n=1 Tax=Salinimicrobium sp. HB62 TaxID=3077781 RepID=UPI002D77886C|nr:Gfo/Idh/MocA family oxidoreductase [Salinimicrobium sp. HB62]
MKQVKTAFAGYGPGGSIYNSPILSSVPGFVVTKILTSSTSNIALARRDHPRAEIVDNFSEILKDPEINLVILVLPNHLHYSFAKQALEAGKHVLVEKPFTSNVKEANELINLAHQKKLILSVHHNRRWDSDFQTVKKVVETGLLGKVVEYEAHFDRFRNEVKPGWKEKKENPGSGILYDLGSHLIDQALTLFGLPKEVFADIRMQRDGAMVPDAFELLLFYPNLKVTLKAGQLIKEKGPTFQVFGTRGSFVKYGADVQEEALKAGKKPSDTVAWGTEPKEIWGKLNTLEEERLVDSEPGNYPFIFQNLLKAITEGAALAVTPQQARDVIRIIEAAHKSQDERCVVTFG